ncbi:hypothetical protein MKX01_042154 [Papaver californicum]|nr:hypothetical protein MKX01_042154 [Papaver californicum]
MDRYKKIKEVGEGTYGSVCQALDTQTGEIVAIKRMKKKYYSFEECLNLPEVQSLRKMTKHKNIVQLKGIFTENNILYCVFEYLECDLYQLMEKRVNPFSEDQIRDWFCQIFQALAYMHQCAGYFHRDLKPENLLVTKDERTIKNLFQPPYTDYVSTRWYRAPKVLLKPSSYSAAVDMWAMGAILAELFTLSPLFPGTTEADKLYKICSVIGSPNQESWAEGLQLAKSINFQFPQLTGVRDLSVLKPFASDAAISLITLLCSWDPNKRPTAHEALQHPFFRSCYYIPPSLRSRTIVTTAKSLTLPVRMTTDITLLSEQLMTGKLLAISTRKVIVPPRQKQATLAAAAPPPHMKTGGWHGSTIFIGHHGRLLHGNSSVTGGRLGDEIYI